MVCSTMSLGSTSLSLNPILFEHFDQGWDPDNYGRVKLEEATVLWLKGLDTITLPAVMPDIVASALQSFQKMKASTEKLAESQEQAAKVKNAAGKTAEAKFQSMLHHVLANGTDPVAAQEALEARKKVLEKWVASRRDHADNVLKDMEMEHNAIRDSFEMVVAELVNHSHKEYKSTPKRQTVAPVLPDESALFEELDMELNSCFEKIPSDNVLKLTQDEQLEPLAMKAGDDHQLKPQKGEAADCGLPEAPSKTIEMTQMAPQEAPAKTTEMTQTAPQEAPSKTTEMTQTAPQEPSVANTVTGTYEAMKEAIDKVAEKSKIPEALRVSLVGSVQQCVKSTLVEASLSMEEGNRPRHDGAPGDGPSHEPAPSGHLPAPNGDAPSGSGGGEPCDVPCQREGSAGKPIEVPDGPGNGGQSTAKAVELELRRKDTSQLALGRANTRDLESEELAKCAVPQEDGTILYMNKKGKLETLDEREKRLAHNSYVAFSRSFDGLSLLLH